MSQSLVLIANEPKAYREAIAVGLHHMRPETGMLVVEPEMLDSEVIARCPQLVICSHLSEIVAARILAWVLLYPESTNLAVVSVCGTQVRSTGFTLDDLADVIDQVRDFPCEAP